MKMDSPPPRIDFCYGAGLSGYDLVLRQIVDGHQTLIEIGVVDRALLVEITIEQIQEMADPDLVVRIYAEKYPGPDSRYHLLSRFMLGALASTVSSREYIIGRLASFLDESLQRSVSKLLPVRLIPGRPEADRIECLFCGRAAAVNPQVITSYPSSYTSLRDAVGPEETARIEYITALPETATCLTCGSVSHLIFDKFRGICLDVASSVNNRPGSERLYINYPWNPTAPWMTVSEFYNLAKESN